MKIHFLFQAVRWVFAKKYIRTERILQPEISSEPLDPLGWLGSRVEWFLKKEKTGIRKDVLKWYIGPQFQNFTLNCCFLNWHRALETCARRGISLTRSKELGPKKLLISSFLVVICFLKEHGRYLKTLLKAISMVSVFIRNKALPCARPNLPIFWNWTHTNLPDRQQCAVL